MKVSSPLTLLALLGAVISKSYNLHLYADSLEGNQPFDGLYAQAVRVEPDTYQFFLGDKKDAATIHFDDSACTSFLTVEGVVYYLAVSRDNYIVATSKPGQHHSQADPQFRSFYLAGYKFHASMNVEEDPLGYSQDHFSLLSQSATSGGTSLLKLRYEVLRASTNRSFDDDENGILNPSSIEQTGTVTPNDVYSLNTHYESTDVITNSSISLPAFLATTAARVPSSTSELPLTTTASTSRQNDGATTERRYSITPFIVALLMALA